MFRELPVPLTSGEIARVIADLPCWEGAAAASGALPVVRRRIRDRIADARVVAALIAADLAGEAPLA
ncbi:hypothetical protein [Planobispora rosea]|uniref:hypothetical protein n=1 Tax=Planobispora rosea TaxID=35762 RepID=UPI00083A582B|nr:hypothetical protein [Planobispora rosea]